MRKYILLLLFIALNIDSTAQPTHWYFGKEAGIIFNNVSVVADTSGKLRSIEASACIDFSDGTFIYTNGYRCWDNNHQLITNSDSIFKFLMTTNYLPIYYGNTSVNGCKLLPFNDFVYVLVDNQYGGSALDLGIYAYKIYRNNQAFHISVESIRQLINHNNIHTIESLAACKHANGRDYWLVSHLVDSTNTFIKFLVAPDTIYSMPNQKIGSIEYYLNSELSGQTLFNQSGTKLYMSHWNGLIDVFDFNRCTGELKNFVNIKPGTFNPGFYNKERVYGMSVSPDGSKIYASGWKWLIQYSIDTNTNQLLSQDTIWNNPYFPSYNFCDNNNCVVPLQHQLAPNGKIYIANGTAIIDQPSNNDTIQTYLSVINNPNAQGSACNFQPYAVSLLGRKSWACLPNNPNYNLGPLAGSPCDTLTTSNELKPNKNIVRVYPNPASDYITLFVPRLTKAWQFALYDIQGREVLHVNSRGAFRSINISHLAQGMYLWKLVYEDGKVENGKMVKQ
ncbi:hypothetical protein LBMAG25_11690 [Bacteroidota bacterium]|nr:hypothetical protein LBMAG25_11690 [Bacteroidota bacterium]